MPNSEEFPQIKRDLVNTVKDIKKHIDGESIQREEVRVLLGKISAVVFGDPTANPPLKGFHARLEILEAVEKERVKAKDNAINLAVGSAAIAIGGAVCWIGLAIKEAFMKGH